MKKLIIVILALLTTEFIMACCECTAPTFHNYTNTGLSLKNLDNSGAVVVESSSNVVSRTAYGIRLRIKGEKIVSIQRMPSLFTQPLYATSCECPPDIQYIPKDSITDIKIATLS
ncbi:MAG TPA: DUF5034 domain-containing protein, partial [Patescibacteria group bacterium]|nr:DUF5034 domain-containing protein [Patescibacteria group bacterium]